MPRVEGKNGSSEKGEKLIMKMKNVAIAGVLATSLFTTLHGAKAATPASQDLIIVNDFYNKLAFFDNGMVKFVEPVAMGKGSTRTPFGTFKIAQKIVNRPYYKGKIAGGSEKNPLGTRWLGLNIPGSGYGIHGHAVGNESSIGKDVSSGCIRLLNKTNVKLYPYVNVGTKVIITNSSKSFQQIAKDNKYTVKGFSNTTPVKAVETVWTAKFIGLEDSHSFEVRTSHGSETIERGSISVSSLREGTTYKFTVKKNQYGQNILVKFTR